MRTLVRVPVFVTGPDSITIAGVISQLRGRPEIEVVPDQSDHAEVALVCHDVLDEDAVRACRSLQRNGCPQVVLLLGQVTDHELLRAVNVGVAGLVRRSEATPQKLVDSVLVASRGEASLPSDLLHTLLQQVKESQDDRSGSGLSWQQVGLSDREIEVLRRVADGHDTKEIASDLCYSERTIKNIIHDVTRRFGLRNRSHAVAYALRRGLI